jgi:hypothetical protein
VATEFFLRRINGRLTPETASDAEAMDELSSGVTYRAVLTRAAGRSIQHHRLLFALISIARENYDGPISTDAVLDVLKVQTGHVHVVKLMTGAVILTPASISFAKMDQDVFNKWFERAVDVLTRDFVPGLSADLARREIDRRAGYAPLALAA